MMRVTHCQIVTKQLHDQGAVFVGVTVESVQHGYGFVKGLQETRGAYLMAKWGN